MITVNLVCRQSPSVPGRLLPAVNLLLAILCAVQITVLVARLVRKAGIDQTTQALQSELGVLKTKREAAFARAADAVAVEGSLRERNEWLLGRAASPYLLLARFEATKPPGGSFLSFQGTRSTGTIKVSTPDLGTAQEWLKSALGRLSGTLTVERQDHEGTKVLYAWSE